MTERTEIIGPCTLIQGDCVDVLPGLEMFDCGITSPPYNCGKDYGISGDSLEITDYWAWLEDVVARLCARLYLSASVLCINHGNYVGSRESRSYVPDELPAICGRHLPFIDHVIWDKGPPNGAAWGNYPTSPRMRAQHENIWVYGKPSQNASDITWKEWSSWTTSIWRIPTTGVDSTIHPAMMPLEVALRLVKLYSPTDGTVIDPFLGSGTTAIACIQAGRRFVGIEKDPGYFDKAVNRVKRAWQLKRSELPLESVSQAVQQEIFE